MELLLRQDLHEVWFAHLRPPYAFTSPIPNTEFALLIVQSEEKFSPDDRRQLSQAFVDQGCRSAVCAGHECSLWDDSIDMVCVMAKIEDGRELPYIQTSWHEHDTFPEVIDFLIQHTQYEDRANGRFVIVVLGGDEATALSVRDAVLTGFKETDS